MKANVTAVDVYKEAYIYGFPMVDSNRIQHSYSTEEESPGCKGDWNVPRSVAPPLPAEPFFLGLREYWRKPPTLGGEWTPPRAVRTAR